jgi:uncharacterized membrane protein (DUF106 family)
MIASYIAKTADIILAPLLSFSPLVSITILSFAFSLLVLLYQRKIFNNKSVKEVKRKLDEIREKIIKVQNKNQDEMNKMFDEMLKLNAKILKENLKVTLLSLILGIILISWVSFHYSGYYLKVPFPYFNNMSLVYFYVIFSLVIGVIIGKFLEVR